MRTKLKEKQIKQTPVTRLNLVNKPGQKSLKIHVDILMAGLLIFSLHVRFYDRRLVTD